MTKDQALSGEVMEKSNIPEKWQEKFWLHRIGFAEVEISKKIRDELLQAMNDGARFFQVGKRTIMVNSIQAIEPYWGENNVPPRPQPKEITEFTGTKAIRSTDDSDGQEWDQYFGKDKYALPQGD